MGQYKVVKLLVESHADAATEEGNSALYCSVHIGNDSLVKMLLAAEADPSAGLPAAAFRGNHKFVKLLLHKQADPSSQKKALKEAARFGHQEILQTLLKHGADAASRAGDSALRLVVNSSGRTSRMKSEMMMTLEDYGARRLPPVLPALPD